MPKVISDALLEADRGEVILLCMLDLSAAFDMVDHDILVDQLQTGLTFMAQYCRVYHHS